MEVLNVLLDAAVIVSVFAACVVLTYLTTKGLKDLLGWRRPDGLTDDTGPPYFDHGTPDPPGDWPRPDRAEREDREVAAAGGPPVYYFAHPYRRVSSVDEAEQVTWRSPRTLNARLCRRRTARLLDAGYDVVSPVLMTHQAARTAPVEGWSEGQWLSFCKRMLRGLRFQGIILSPGWRESEGCRMEQRMADELDMEILYFEDCVEGST